MTALVFVVVKLVVIGLFFSVGMLLLKGMYAFGGLLTQVGKAAFETDDNTLVTIYPTKSAKGDNRSVNRDDVHTARSSSFFDDIADLDLEYRGVGASETRYQTNLLGQVVPKRAGKQHGGSRRSAKVG